MVFKFCFTSMSLQYLKKKYTLHFVIQLPGQARTPLCHPSPRKLRPGSLQHLQPQHLTEKISKSALTMCLWCYHNSWCLLYTWISNENKHVNIFGGKYKYQPLLKLGITLYRTRLFSAIFTMWIFIFSSLVYMAVKRMVGAVIEWWPFSGENTRPGGHYIITTVVALLVVCVLLVFCTASSELPDPQHPFWSNFALRRHPFVTIRTWGSRPY